MVDADLENWIRQLPKVELHVHLEGSIRPQTLTELAAKNGVDLPGGVTAIYQFSDFSGFLDAYMRCAACLCTQGDFERVTYEFLLDQAALGIHYCEVFLSSMQHLRRDFDFDCLMQGIQAGYRQARSETGIRMGVIFDHGRQFGAQEGLRVLERAIGTRKFGVIGLSIGGDEVNFPPELFEEMFLRARQAGLRVTAHAGEVRGPESVWGAIHKLGVRRIGHGIHAIQDPDLMAYLQQQRIYLDICPTSNVRTGAVPSLNEHPVRRLFDAGVPLTISSDDPALFQTNLVQEYLLLAQHFGFDRRELQQLSLNGVRASFLPEQERAELQARFQQALTALVV
ncbi:MAG: adenosine deaminase [Chloroflexia bacterium]|nr:adenosine deaminase [Chloroflexia bacterium]